LSLRRVLVTGGRGFIGLHLVEMLARNHVAVVSVDTKPTRGETADGVVQIVGDVRDRGLMSDCFAGGCDCVFDLAALADIGLSAAEYQRNVEQTKAMVEYCLEFSIDKYIFYSTQFVFRRPGALPTSDTDYAPSEAYGESKVESEILITKSFPADRFLILRPSYIWGPGLDRFRDGLLYRLLRGQLLICNDRELKRYYGYVETIAAQTLAFARLSFADLPRKVYYISDDAITVAEFCRYLVSALGLGKARPAPAALIRVLGAAGAVLDRAGIHAPINPVQACELTTNFPIPIEPTLRLTQCTTDLPSAAAKTVAWAAQTDRRFASAVGTGMPTASQRRHRRPSTARRP
jgi:nucleoside-diphosphate-sugar epimerase